LVALKITVRFGDGLVMGLWEAYNDNAMHSTTRSLLEKGLDEAKRMIVWPPFVNMTTLVCSKIQQ
jgi:hypothetical protein